MVDYSYQKPLIKDCLKSLYAGKKTLLAACPGAGKTVMAIQIAKKYLDANPKSKVLILTHGQIVLRAQWLNQLAKYFPLETFTEIDPSYEKEISHRIFVAIPQSYRQLSKYIQHIDLLIVDEAHHYYGADLVNKIKGYFKPKSELLLTGTPSKYIGKDWNIFGITLQELIEYNAITDPEIQLIESSYDLCIDDYNEALEVKQSKAINGNETLSTFNKVLNSLISRLKTKNIRDLQKTMMVCANQAQAKVIYSQLVKLKINPLLSISDTTTGEHETALFISDPSYPVLIVVGRGVLGFDFPGLVNVVDFTESLNVNKLFQLLCRVVRKGEAENTKKYFIKLTSKRVSPLCYYVMSFVVSLSSPEYYLSYSTTERGLTLGKRAIAVKKEFLDQLNDNAKAITVESLPSLMTFEDFKDIYESKETKIIAYTTFRKVRDRLSDLVKWNVPKALEIARACKSRAEFSKKYQGAAWHLKSRGRLSDLDEIFPLKRRKHFWSHEAVEKAIKEANSCNDLMKSGVYQFLARTGQLDRVSHLVKRTGKMDTNKALKQAKECKSVSRFKSSRAAQYLKENDLFHLAEKHLDKKRLKKRIPAEKFEEVTRLSKTMPIPKACEKVGIKYQTYYAREIRRKV